MKTDNLKIACIFIQRSMFLLPCWIHLFFFFSTLKKKFLRKQNYNYVLFRGSQVIIYSVYIYITKIGQSFTFYSEFKHHIFKKTIFFKNNKPKHIFQVNIFSLN